MKSGKSTHFAKVAALGRILVGKWGHECGGRTTCHHPIGYFNEDGSARHDFNVPDAGGMEVALGLVRAWHDGLDPTNMQNCSVGE